MKRILFFATALAFTFPLWSDNQENINTPMIGRDVGNASTSGVRVDAEYEMLHRARFHKPEHARHHHLSVSATNVIASYFHVPSDKKTGYTLGVGYLGVDFHFSKRKAFSQKHFDNALFNIGGFTKEIQDWKWSGDLLTQINGEHFSLSRYTFFTGLLKGKYAWHEKSHLYTGILAYAGMHYSRALPVLGFDYTFNEKWKLNLVFPLNSALRYKINKNWSVDAGIRYFLTRQRLQEDDSVRRGFVAFRNWSAEIGVNWALGELIQVNAHVGQSLSNRMRVSNRHDAHRKHYRLGNAPGFGFVATIKV